MQASEQKRRITQNFNPNATCEEIRMERYIPDI